MTRSRKIEIPESAIEELDLVAQMDWNEGISLQELISWINQIVDRFRPDAVDSSARSSPEFTPRSFRHYQTMGCIDAPQKIGREARYGFKHYLQGLLVRKLLWERVPSDQIAEQIHGKSVRDLREFLLSGIAVTDSSQRPENETTQWTRIPVAQGIELNLEAERPTLSRKQKEQLIARIREFL